MAFLAPSAYRLSHLLVPPLLRSSNLSITRLFSESKHNQDEKEAFSSNSPKSVTVCDGPNSWTPDEFKAGHPAGAMNIAYMFQTNAGMLKNPEFEQEVLSSFKKDDQIIIGCRSGKRSLMAATDLTSVGFKNVVDLAGGYIAWTETSLPVRKAE